MNPRCEIAWVTNFFVVLPNICVFNMELVSCHLSGTYDFEVAARFVGDLCTPALDTVTYVN
jgi:hypothetical protein